MSLHTSLGTDTTIIKYSLGKQYLSAIVNNDFSGLEGWEVHELNLWWDKVYSKDAVFSFEELEGTFFTQCEASGLHNNCCVVIKHISSF